MNTLTTRTLTYITLCVSGVTPALAQEAVHSAGTLAEVIVVGTTPVGNTGIPISKFAGNVQTLSRDNLTTDTVNLVQRIDQSLGSVNINDTQGSPFQVDLNYRGFTASPALGTPQGLSVFLDGMRLNEPFGDVVSWDSLPQLAIDKVTLIPGSNPVYGLNTLGGAIALTTKNGNTFTGSQGGISVGSFGRVSVDVEHGSHSDDDNLYFAASLYNDKGWAVNNPSQVRQLFGKYTKYITGGDAAVSLLYADNLLYGNQSVPLSMLDNAAKGYSHPDYTGSQTFMVNAQANVGLDESNTISGNLYFRDVTRDILNSNVNLAPADSTNDPSCTTNPTIDCPAANLLAHYKQQIVGTNLQWSNTDFVFGKNQITNVGVNAEYSDTSFANSGQYATLDSTNGMVAANAFMSQADIKSSNQRYGIFATSTIDATDKLSVTASARFDYAILKLSGTSCIDSDLCDLNAGIGLATAVTGEHSYQRFNPSLGFTYVVAPDLTAFGNYAEGFRTPSAIELACADPAAPCSAVPNAFGADPELQAVVSKTYEVGMRGNVANLLKWRTSYYRTELENDILFNQSSLTTGYFSNVGQTLRQGIEIGLDGKLGQLDYSLDLDRIEATYQSSFTVANTSNSAAATPVQAGNRIPSIPQWVFKSRFSYPVTAQTRLALGIQSQGSTFARGDDNNADVNGQVAGFTTVKLDVQHSVNKRFSLYAGVNNLFDVKYATYGALATNNIATGADEQFLSLGAPRTFYAGLQAKF
jgi:outer membrane receptor protein involved in Fe transport